MKNPFYVSRPPYVIAETKFNETVIDSLDRMEEYEVRTHELITNFLVSHGFIKPTSDKTSSYQFSIAIPDDRSDWRYTFFTMNTRSLSADNRALGLETILQLNDGYAMTIILDLLARITMLTSEGFVDILTNKTIKSISNIPYLYRHVDHTADDVWESIHIHQPYLWLIIYLQAFCYSFCDIRNVTMGQ